MVDLDGFVDHLFADVVKADIYVLGSCVMLRIVGKCYSTLVVTI